MKSKLNIYFPRNSIIVWSDRDELSYYVFMFKNIIIEIEVPMQ